MPAWSGMRRRSAPTRSSLSATTPRRSCPACLKCFAMGPRCAWRRVSQRTRDKHAPKLQFWRVTGSPKDLHDGAAGFTGSTSDAARLSAALAGRYRIERELGAGGMATVYLAADLRHDRKVAIKVLKPELAA